MILRYSILICFLSTLGAQIDYNTLIQPIFNASCTSCHGGAGGLNLSSYENVMAGGNSGAALGDVTGDGNINILDLVQITSLILEVSTPAFECAADFTGDGNVNILDLVQIANYILDN